MKRALTLTEIAEARKIFGNALDYRKIRIYERWPRFGFIRRWRTAFGLGNSARFPRRIDTSTAEDMAWLIHELTHVWQFQKQGWIYLLWALESHKQANPYDYGGEEGLVFARERGLVITDFNPEQQGEIARSYYYLTKKGISAGAWEPFIEDIRRS